MVESGDALAVMGNHEYNAIAFHTTRAGRPTDYFRPHTHKNQRQHRATLDRLSSSELADAIEWFRALPVAIELNGIRAAHAAWQDRDIQCIDEAVNR